MRAVLLLLPVLLAACDRTPVDGNVVQPVAEAPVAAPAPNAAEPAGIGTTSTLTATTSPLTGQVSDFQVRTTDTETIVALAADTLFAFDSATLTAAAAANLERTAALVAKGKPGAVRIVGHTDAKGDDAYNDALSTRRAEAVATWLRGQSSLVGRSFTTEGRGEREPVAPNTASDGSDDPAGRARNRRVEVVIPR